MKAIDLNEAFRVYLAASPTGGVQPYGGMERLKAHYGDDAAAAKLAISAVLDALFEENEVWQLDLTAIGDFAERRAQERRPELADIVCRAIGNYVHYNYSK